MGKYWSLREHVVDLPFIGPNHYVITDLWYFHNVKHPGSGALDGRQRLTVQVKNSTLGIGISRWSTTSLSCPRRSDMPMICS